MRTYTSVAALVIVIAGCAASEPEIAFQPADPPQPALEVSIERFQPPEVRKTLLSELLPVGHVAGSAIDVEGVQLVSILAPDAPFETPYITLHEALELNLASVREDGRPFTHADGTTGYRDGDVNRVRVTNRADKPLFLMVGDLLLGGKQDRVLAKNVIVEPTTEEQLVEVYCVEQGRWSLEDSQRAAGGQFYRQPAQEQVDATVKAAALSGAGQSAVWDAVGRNNERLGVTRVNKGGSFRATFDHEATRNKLNNLAAQVAAARAIDTVGFALVSEDDVRAMDIFDSKELCAKLSDKLIRSYLVTALSGAHAPPPAMHPLAERLADKVTLNIHCIPMHLVASRIQQEWGVPIHVGPGCNPHHRVDLDSCGADMLSVFQALATNGVIIEIGRSDVFVVSTPADLGDDRFCVAVTLRSGSSGAFFAGAGCCTSGGSGAGFGTGNDSGFFFQDMPPSNVRATTFNQDIRGRFEALAETSSFTRTLGVGTPVAIQHASVPVGDAPPINYSFTDQKRQANVHRSFLKR